MLSLFFSVHLVKVWKRNPTEWMKSHEHPVFKTYDTIKLRQEKRISLYLDRRIPAVRSQAYELRDRR